MDSRQKATEIFLAGVDSVKPENLIKRFVSIEQYNLQIENFQFDLSTIANIYIVGVGKAIITTFTVAVFVQPTALVTVTL